MGTRNLGNYEDLITFTRASGGTALRPVSYGSELVTNGGFDTDSDWVKTQATISGGVCEINSPSGSYAGVYQAIPATAGKMYFISVEVVSVVTGSALVNVEGGSVGTLTTSGFITTAYVATDDTLTVEIKRGGGVTEFTIDNVSVKEVTFDDIYGDLTLFEHPVDVPRVEWDANGNRLGLLVEESRTNLITHSQDFTNAAWTKTNTATLALDSVGPDGQANSAVNLVDSGATGTGVVFLFDTVTVETSSTYTASVYAKKNGLSDILLYHGNFTTPSDGGYYFNLEDGTITSGGSSGTATIEEAGNGWYRCAITFTTDAADTSGAIRMYVTDGTNITVDLDGTSSVLIYGAQLEKGSFPTSHIKTTGATATRSADVASIPVADFGFNPKSMSMLIEWQTIIPAPVSWDSYNRIVSFGESGGSELIEILGTQNSANVYGSVYAAGAQQISYINFSTNGTVEKTAFRAGSNTWRIANDGTLLTEDTSVTMPTKIDRLGIGIVGTALSGNEINGHIKSIKYYPRRLTDAQLQEITS